MEIEDNRKKLNFLYDTGASANLIKLSCLPKEKRQTITSQNVIITGLTSEEINIIGSCQLDYYLGKHKITFETYVCKDESISLRADGVLSRVFAKHAKMYLRGNNDKVVFRRKCYKLLTYGEAGIDMKRQAQRSEVKASEIQDIRVSGRIELPPESSICFPVKLPKKSSGQFLYVPETANSRAKTIEFIPSMHNLKGHRSINIFVLNASQETQIIYKHVKIGKLIPLTENGLDGLLECNHLSCQKPETRKEIKSYDMRVGPFRDEDEEDSEEFQNRMKQVKDITELIDTSGITEEQRTKLINLVKEYEDIFWRPGMKLTTTHLVQAEIDTGDHPPVMVKPYRTPQKQLQPLKEEIQDLLNQEIIEPIEHSPWNSPAILLTKETHGKIKRRLVIDFRKVNAITAPMTCSFPELFQTIHKAGNSTLFSSLDKIKAFHQIPLRPEDRPKTAFTTEAGKFQFRTMPFGLKNAAIIYQQLVNSLFMARADGFCQAYLDDILVYSKDGTDDHVEKLRQIFKILREANLKLRPDKCCFFQKQVRYLGFQISREGIVPDDEKLQIVKNFPTPENPKHVKQFLGLVTFFAKHCPKFSETAVPLSELTKPSKSFVWTEKCERAFQKLKEQLCRKLRLAFPDPDVPFSMYTDASDLAVGAVLVQEQDGERKPISLASRKLSRAEIKYPTWRKEMQAIKFGVKQFRHFLIGQKFTVYTDHRPLAYINEGINPKPVYLRDAALLSEFTMEIIYIEGEKNTAADTCSRILFDKGKIEFLPDVPREKHETYEEFLQRWQKKFPPVKIEPTLTKSAKRKLERKKQNRAHAESNSKIRNESEQILTVHPPQETKPVVMVSVETQTEAEESKQPEAESDEETEEEKACSLETGKILKDLKKLRVEITKSSVNDADSKEYKTFSEQIMQLLFRADEIQTHGNQKCKAWKSEVTRELLEIQDELDFLVKLNNAPTDNEEEIAVMDVDAVEMDSKYLEDLSSTEDSSSSENLSCEYETAESDQVSTDSETAHELNAIDLETFSKQPMLEMEEIIEAQKSDPLYLEVKKALVNEKSDDEPETKTAEKDKAKQKKYREQFRFEDEILYRINRNGKPVIYIPPPIQKKVLTTYHNSPIINHPGASKLLAFLEQKIWFPKMSQMLRQINKSCETCAQNKPDNRPAKPLMRLYKAPQRPFEDVHMDYFGPIRSPYDPEDLKYGLVVVCRFSHYIEAYPVKDLTEDTLVYTLMTKFVPTHGLPKRFITDNQQTFEAQNFKKWCENYDIKLSHSSAYRPQSNGQAELAVKKVKQAITTLREDPNVPWYRYLPYVLICIRMLPNAATGKSPYEVVYNRDMRFPIDCKLKFSKYRIADTAADGESALWEKTWKAVAENTERYQNQYKDRFDARAKPHKLAVGQTVHIKNKNLSPKFNKIYQKRYEGPYTVTKITEDTAEVVQQDNPSIKRKVHVGRLKQSDTPIKTGEAKIKKQKPKEKPEAIPHNYNLRNRN